MHILELHTHDTIRRALAVIDEDGGALSEVPESAVLRVITEVGEGEEEDTVVEFPMTKLSPRRYYHDFTVEELEALPPNVSTMEPQALRGTADEEGVFPTGKEEEDYLYLIVLTTPEPA